MINLKPFLFAVCVSILFVSCSVIGLNMKRKTPANPAKYPKFTQADTLRGMITHYRKNFDVTYYDIHLDIDIENMYLKGFVDIYFKAFEDIDTLQIDLYGNMKVSGITLQSDSVRFKRKFNAVLVLC